MTLWKLLTIAYISAIYVQNLFMRFDIYSTILSAHRQFQ
jgi:hypothetical protein